MASDQFSELERLWALKKSGALTEKEFNTLKAKALGTAEQQTTGSSASAPVVAEAPALGDAVPEINDEEPAKKSADGCGVAILLTLLALIFLLAVGIANKDRAVTPSDKPKATAVQSTEGSSSVTQMEPRAPSAADMAEHRRKKLSFIQDTPAQNWLVEIPINACPALEDWYPGAKALARGDIDQIPDLPIHCWRIEIGQMIRLPPAGHRKIDQYADHTFMQAIGPNGRVFWTDEFDRLSVRPLGDE